MLDTMTLTKVVGAFCGALLVYLLGGWVGEALYHGGHGDHEQAYVIDTGADDAAEEAEEEVNMVELVAAADPGAGERVFRACAACHKIDEPVNAVGPHLDGVMGREIASIGDFGYSGALPAGEVWSIENMSAWIENPSGFAEGTSMNYRGLAKDGDRADLIAYLISKSPDYTMPEDEADAGDAAAPQDAVAETETAATEAVTEEAAKEEAAAEETATEEAAMDDGATDEAPAPEADAQADAPEESVETAMMTDTDAAATEDATSTAEAAPAEEEAPAETAAMEAAPAETAETEAAEESAFVVAYRDADASAGERVFRQCQACHVAGKEQNRVGPHLVDIVGRPIGAIDGFRYSGALPEGEWTLDNLNAWLENPRGFAQGTSMSYSGLRKMEDRVNVIAYIESLN